MFLKSLELNGFKSFAQKTILEFPKGITAVVGPNGSGKSNVIDAIRWILGEREAKNLRGGKAEDLIFAGTPKKARVGMAQVGIHFDNSAKFFPVEFDEVSITREIARDGNSTYTLNKSEVRAKDIIDFFARSRLGTRGITIINQGSSDLFVRATPQERRGMIEEVLGLKEYQLKKAEAERKLKATGSNLEKIGIMIEEVAPRLRTLKRQVAKYQTRDQKQEELKNIENNYFSFKANEIKINLRKNNQSAIELNQEISSKEKDLEILAQDLKKIESTEHQTSANQDLKNKERDLLDQRSQLQREIGKIEARLEFLTSAPIRSENIYEKEKMFSLLQETRTILQENSASTDIENLLSSIKSLLSKINDFLDGPAKNKEQITAEQTKEISALETNKNDLTRQILQLEKNIEDIKSEEEKITQGLEGFNERFRNAYELKEAKREEIRRLESKREYLSFENEKLNSKLSDLKHDWVINERAENEFDALKFDPSSSQIPQTDDLERQIFRLRAELLSIGEIDDSLIKEAQEVETHYNLLTTQSADLDKALVDLTALIEELKNEINIKFNSAFKEINNEFNNFFRLMFGGGSAKLKIKTEVAPFQKGGEGDYSENELPPANDTEEEKIKNIGIEIELNLPKKRINSLDVLSGGEKSLVSIAALFALISVSPPPFLVLDEIDAPLDEKNSKRFADLIKEFAHKVQFIVVTHNRTIMEVADVLYGVTMNDDGTSKLISLKLEDNISAAKV